MSERLYDAAVSLNSEFVIMLLSLDPTPGVLGGLESNEKWIEMSRK